jgi:hypothetical protein
MIKLYDRYTDEFISEQSMPSQIDFGRYCISEENGSTKEITYSNFQTNKAISQELLLEKNKSIQDVFIDIAIDIEKSGDNSFNVIPIIRRIKNKLGLNEFEKLLYQKLFHLEEIFRVPHYLLKREVEKVHVSRAKRIPSKSYQYLASHTEDWIHKSIVSFKPSRILNEELELNFDVYENQLTVAFLERCSIYLNSRLKEVQDIKSFLSEYEKLLKNRNDQKGWHKKTDRNLSLVGAVYEDKHFRRESKDGSTLTETEEKLNQINKRLLLLRKRELFNLVNKRVAKLISLRNTNVLVNHKHYRYVKSLWIELDKAKPEKSETDRIKFEQEVIKGFRAYGKSLIIYALYKNLEYELKGNYTAFKAEHLQLSEIQFKENDKGVFEIKIGKYEIKIIVLGNQPNIDEQTLNALERQNTYILYYDEQAKSESSRLIYINPLDPDSVERISILFRKFLLSGFLSKINEEYKFKQLLKEYIKYIPTAFLEFNVDNFTYKFHSYPKSQLIIDDIEDKIEKDIRFKKRRRHEQKNIKETISELINDIEKNSARLKDDYLNCFCCEQKQYDYHVNKLNYLKCPHCKCLIDSSQSEKVIFRFDIDENLPSTEFGMDYLIYDKNEL